MKLQISSLLSRLLALQMAVVLLLLLQQGQLTVGVKYVSHKDCNGQPKGTFIANPGNCSQYVQCNGLRSTLGECPTTTYYNPEMMSCDTSPAVCKTKQPSKTTTAPTLEPVHSTFTTPEAFTIPASTTQTALPTTTPPITTLPAGSALGRPLCTAWFDQQYPHPFNCEYYYYCIRGYLTIRRCSFGLGWDLDRQRCVPIKEAHCFRAFRH